MKEFQTINIPFEKNYFSNDTEYPLEIDKLYYRLLSECKKRNLFKERLNTKKISEITELEHSFVEKYIKQASIIHLDLSWSWGYQRGETYCIWSEEGNEKVSIKIPLFMLDAIYKYDALTLEEAQVYFYIKLSKKHQLFLDERDDEEINDYLSDKVLAKRLKRGIVDIRKNIECLIIKGFLEECEVKSKKDLNIKEHFNIQLEVMFDDGDVRELRSVYGVKAELFDGETMETMKRTLTEMFKGDEDFRDNARITVENLYGNRKVNSIKYHLTKDMFYLNSLGEPIVTEIDRIFLFGESWMEPIVKTEIIEKEVVKYIKQKKSFYVYKHFYYDENGDEVVFYIGKGTGDAKGSATRMYDCQRNKYWDEIVSNLNKKNIQIFKEPIKFFDTESEALNFEAKLHKEYWNKGECLGCADLRRRYNCL